MPPSEDHAEDIGALCSLDPLPAIDILLPSKEQFGPANAGAVSTVVHDLITASRTPHCFHVYGAPVDEPFERVGFTGLAPRHAWLHGKNIGLANAYLQHLRGRPLPDLVEVHSRCQVASRIKAKRPELNVALYLHNDPRDMKGSQTTAERKRLLHDMSAVICVSDYIRGCFLDGLDVAAPQAGKVQTARNGVDRWLAAPVVKTPMVLFVGRMVPEKGILEFSQALAEVLQDYPEWSVVIVGARQFETSKPGSYENRVAEALAPLGARASMTGFLPLDKVKGLQQEAAIIGCPSIWEEPLGKTGLEALAAGSALLTTRRGGIPEVAAGRAHIVDEPSPEAFADALRKLIGDDEYRAGLQQVAWDDFPFTATEMASVADRIRIDAIKRSYNAGK